MNRVSANLKKVWNLSLGLLWLLSCFSISLAQETTLRSPIIEDIRFSGNTAFADIILLHELPFNTGSTYSRPLILEGKYYIYAYYTDHGFKYSQVNPETLVNESTGNYRVIYHIQEGVKTYIGQITISGNTKTEDRVIRRELLFHTGNTFSRRDIYVSQSRLLALNYFEDVKIEEANPDQQPENVDLVVKVTEKNTGLFSFGGGFSTEEGIRGFIRYRQSNLFGTGRQFSSSVKWSERGQAFQRSREIRLDYFDPHFLETDFGFGAEAYFRRENLDNYDLQRIGGDISLAHEILDSHTHGTLKYRVETDKTFNISNSIDSSVIAIEGQRNLITELSLNLTRDTRDNIAYPAYGYILSSDIALASEVLGGDLNFYKIQLDGRWYIPIIRPKLILALRATAGYEDPFGGTNDIPIYERLFAGGADSVRGFKERYLGPKDADGFPTGGRASFVYNVELRFPIYKSFTGVAFYDAGNVWKTAGELDPTDLEHAVGAGLRYQTPIGPIRFDYGIHIPQTDSGHFYISVGQTF